MHHRHYLLTNQQTTHCIDIIYYSTLFIHQRRAKSEDNSRMKGLRERAKKGLLSDSEKVILAEEEAKLAQRHGKKKNGDCIII